MQLYVAQPDRSWHVFDMRTEEQREHAQRAIQQMIRERTRPPGSSPYKKPIDYLAITRDICNLL